MASIPPHLLAQDPKPRQATPDSQAILNTKEGTPTVGLGLYFRFTDFRARKLAPAPDLPINGGRSLAGRGLQGDALKEIKIFRDKASMVEALQADGATLKDATNVAGTFKEGTIQLVETKVPVEFARLSGGRLLQ